MVESIGKRIAQLRQKNGWTQQSLAERLAMSRVAISHIEMDLTIPSERSIILMAGTFKLSPIDLVEGTAYPQAKAERLPSLTATFSGPELDLALLANDVDWLARFEDQRSKFRFLHETLEKWRSRIRHWDEENMDEHESSTLHKMHQILQQLNDQMNNYLE